MAGAPPLLKNRFIGVLLDAVKVAVAAWAAIYVEPGVSKLLPTIGEPLQYLIAAFIAAAVLEALLQIVLGWPRIEVEWTDKTEDVPISGIVARIRPANQESQPFALTVSTPSGGWLGYQVLRLWMRLGVRLQIRVESALVVPTCEYPSKRGGVPTVMPDDDPALRRTRPDLLI